MGKMLQMGDCRAKIDGKSHLYKGFALIELLLALFLAMAVASAIYLAIAGTNRTHTALSTLPSASSTRNKSISNLPTPTSSPWTQTTQANSKHFFNANACSVEVSPFAPATVKVEIVYCTRTPSAGGSIYTTIPIPGLDEQGLSSMRGEIVDGNLYITRSSSNGARQDQLMLYEGSSSVREIYQLPGTESTTIELPAVSPDQRWIAFINNDGTEDSVGPSNSGELDIVSSDGAVLKTFSPQTLHVTPQCNCDALILGWGDGALWLTKDDLDPSATVDFLKINTDAWSVFDYPTDISEDYLQYSQYAMNFDTGIFLMTDLPSGPGSLYALSQESATVFSVSAYNIETGSSQTVETTTGALAAPGDANADLNWLDDNTIQYFDFSSGKLATATLP